MSIKRRSKLNNLIGKKIVIVGHSNESLIGYSGTVLFESENMIELLRSDGRIVKIPKNSIVLKVFYNGDKTYKILSYKNVKGSIIKRLSRL
ncbi:TPA: hypothetical protein EYP83_03745 [Candidatus Geothermarchaeota archaeon]|nr:hypothetical protein [Candidatus Geothermarchaeota archaeon]HIQ12912.1 hypothetical protein [Thermoprotei archaeon]